MIKKFKPTIPFKAGSVAKDLEDAMQETYQKNLQKKGQKRVQKVNQRYV